MGIMEKKKHQKPVHALKQSTMHNNEIRIYLPKQLNDQ
jgi:hypothetical protein